MQSNNGGVQTEDLLNNYLNQNMAMSQAGHNRHSPGKGGFTMLNSFVGTPTPYQQSVDQNQDQGGLPKSHSVQEAQAPGSSLIPQNPNKFRRKTVKRIIKKRTLENAKTGECLPISRKRDVSPEFKEKVTFDVITTKFERDGSQSMHRVESYRDNQPKVLKELKTSMKLMDQIKEDKEHSVIKIPAEMYYNNKKNNHRKFKTNRNLSEREKEKKDGKAPG